MQPQAGEGDQHFPNTAESTQTYLWLRSALHRARSDAPRVDMLPRVILVVPGEPEIVVQFRRDYELTMGQTIYGESL